MDKDIIIKDFTQRYILFLEASQQDITDKNYQSLTERFYLFIAKFTKDFGNNELSGLFASKTKIGYKLKAELENAKSYDGKITALKAIFQEALHDFII